MGGICTKILSSEVSRSSKILNNKVGCATSVEKKVRDVGCIEEVNKLYVSEDVLSKGDYNRDEMKNPETNELHRNLVSQNVMVSDDISRLTIPVNSVDTEVVQVSNTENDLSNVEETQQNINNRQQNSAKQGNESQQEVPEDQNDSFDNKCNNKAVTEDNGCSSVEIHSAIQRYEVKEASTDGHTTRDFPTTKNDQREIVGQVKVDKLDGEGATQANENESATASCLELPQTLDNLYFFPLAEGPETTQPPKLPERLQNRSCKQTLMTYDERMLLADLNRFEQLDKRREFAVRRNRSISRNGRLPKITGMEEMSPVNSATSLDCPND